MFKVWPSRHFRVSSQWMFIFYKRDQDSTRRNKDAISRLSPCENSFGTDTWRPTVLEHFIIVALMLYDGQAAGKCLHFTDPYPIPDFPVPPSFAPPRLSRLGHPAFRAHVVGGLSCWTMQNWLLWKEIYLDAPDLSGNSPSISLPEILIWSELG